jgi:hypothetical protein
MLIKIIIADSHSGFGLLLRGIGQGLPKGVSAAEEIRPEIDEIKTKYISMETINM